MLGVLSQDGIMRFIHIENCKLLFDVGSLDNRVHNVCVSPTGRHVVGVMESGNLCVYDVRSLTAEVNKVRTHCTSLCVYQVLFCNMLSSGVKCFGIWHLLCLLMYVDVMTLSISVHGRCSTYTVLNIMFSSLHT